MCNLTRESPAAFTRGIEIKCWKLNLMNEPNEPNELHDPRLTFLSPAFAKYHTDTFQHILFIKSIRLHPIKI